jgi:protein gp37
MGETTIQWTDYTFNPWVGCQRVSPGCEHCYAEAYDKRVGGVPKAQRPDPSKPLLRWGPTAPRVRTSAANWRKPLKWDLDAKFEQEAANVENGHPPARRRRVFCASLADVFEDRPELVPWRNDLWHLIDETPHLDWLLLTKRPENLKRWLPWVIGEDAGGVVSDGSPWPNVWLGATVEDQQRANERIPHLTLAPAVVHFLSCEPLLGPVRLPLLPYHVDWVIVGGESGGGARRFDVEWARTIKRDIAKAGPLKSRPVALFVKQMGANVIDRNDAGFNGDDDEGWHSAVEYGGEIRVEEDLDGYRDGYQGAPVRVHLRDGHGGDMAEWPADLRVREFPNPNKEPSR